MRRKAVRQQRSQPGGSGPCRKTNRSPSGRSQKSATIGQPCILPGLQRPSEQKSHHLPALRSSAARHWDNSEKIEHQHLQRHQPGVNLHAGVFYSRLHPVCSDIPVLFSRKVSLLKKKLLTQAQRYTLIT